MVSFAFDPYQIQVLKLCLIAYFYCASKKLYQSWRTLGQKALLFTEWESSDESSGSAAFTYSLMSSECSPCGQKFISVDLNRKRILTNNPTILDLCIPDVKPLKACIQISAQCSAQVCFLSHFITGKPIYPSVDALHIIESESITVKQAYRLYKSRPITGSMVLIKLDDK